MHEKLYVKSAKIRGNNTKNTMFALFLVLTIAVTLVVLPSALPVAKAHTPAWNFPTYAYLSVQPNPVAVGQAAFVNFWLDKAPPTAAVQYGDRWHGFKVTVTKPDGTTENLALGSHSNSDAVGGSYIIYAPTTVGSYTFVFSFPGQTITGENPNPLTGTSSPLFVGDYYQPSTSTPVTLTAQQEQIPTAPSTPLPTGYWQRPIYAENTEWYTISGNWFGYNAQAIGGYSGGGSYSTGQNIRLEGNFNPYTTAPNTAHIVWTKPYAPGGLIGGEYGGDQERSMYYATAQYETKFAPIIMNGVLYYSLIPGASTNRAGWVAVDLRSGETIWTKDTNEALSTGQILDYVSPNQYGGIAYLWSRPVTNMGALSSPTLLPTYRMYDAMTGSWILDIVNGTEVVFTPSKDGSLLSYYINSTTRTLNLWNSTKAIIDYCYITRLMTNVWQWRPPQGVSIPFSYGIQWTVPMVTNMTASNGTIVDIDKVYAEASGAVANLAIKRVDMDSGVIFVHNLPIGFTEPGWAVMEGYSATTGQLLWGPLNQTFPAWCRIWEQGGGDGVMTFFVNQFFTWSGYSITTGQKLWGPVKAPGNAWTYYQMHAMIAYGNLYTADIGGFVNCFDAKTGNLKWTWNTGSSGYETPYGIWPIINFECIADGKLYVMGGHMYSPPLFHGAKLYCIDATSGQEIWSISAFGITNHAACAIVDGYMLMPNAYDNQIYCYNKGRSATTVSIQNDVVSLGNTVLIKGTVTDQSPGQTCLGIPAAGTPAISDDNMSAWMEYLYQQQPKPTNAKGVPVHLTAIDPNGNTQEIGTVTSDTDGKYSIMWTPPIEGKYTIVANFDGTNSYYSSHDSTALGVTTASAAPVTTPTPTATPTATPTSAPTASPSPVPQPEAGPSTDMYIIAAAAVIVIIVVVAAAAIFMRKRK